MKAYNEQDHREALLLRRLKFLLSYPSALIQSLPNKKAFREVILEKLRHPPWEMMKKSKDYDDWLCSLVKADCWQPFAARTLERERWGVFFFFKQKTAYEMVYSDWSSDVCSSDLAALQISVLRAGKVLELTGNLP